MFVVIPPLVSQLETRNVQLAESNVEETRCLKICKFRTITTYYEKFYERFIRLENLLSKIMKNYLFHFRIIPAWQS